MLEATSGRTIRQVRWLTQALIISGAFNIGLLATFFYLLLRQNTSADVFYNKPNIQKTICLDEHHNNAKMLTQLEGLTFDQLLGKLDLTQCVEDGYTIRDLSLASLVLRYQFHLEKALDGKPLQQRV